MTLQQRLAAIGRWIRPFLAADAFRGRDGVLGGDLVDVATPFAMRDKVFHFLAGVLLQLLFERWAPVLSHPVAWGLAVIAVALAWEILELLRWLAWRRRGAGEWPLAADRVSWRDVVATIAGAVAAWAVL